MKINSTYNIDALEGAKILPDKSIDCVVTSPPYYGLRDYGVCGQIGLEESPEQYIERLVLVFRELRRVLKDEGTIWINIADSYAGSGKGAWKNKIAQKETYVPDPDSPQIQMPKAWNGIKPKDLIGIPWMLAFALRADGWYLRQEIIWHKRNAMPESVRDRCSKSHEQIFLLTKSARYYFDYEAIQEVAITAENRPSGVERNRTLGYNSKENLNPEAYRKKPHVVGGRKRAEVNATLDPSDPMYRHNTSRVYEYNGKANKRSVWDIPTKPFKEAHFAAFPENLITPCILAGCPGGGVVLDPFNGSGTTGIVANKLGRKYIGFELNPDYIEIENRRRHKELGIFNTAAL